MVFITNYQNEVAPFLALFFFFFYVFLTHFCFIAKISHLLRFIVFSFSNPLCSLFSEFDVRAFIFVLIDYPLFSKFFNF